MRDFFSKFIGFSIGPIIGALISFITIPITSHFVSADQFGLTNMYTLATNIITLIVVLGMDQAFIRQYNETKDKKQLLFNSLIIPLIATIIIGISLITFRRYFSFLLFSNYDFSVPIVLLAVSMPLFIIEKFMLLSIRMQEKAVQYSLWNIISKIFNLIFILILLLVYKRNFESIVYANIISEVLVSLLILIISRENISFSFKNVDKKILLNLFKFGFPLLPATVIGWGLNSMDSIFLRTFSNYTELGYYTVSLKVSNVLGLLQSSFCTFWSPMAFKWKANNEDNKKFELVMNGVSCVMSILLIMILLFKSLIPIVFGKEYYNIIYIIPFLLYYPIFYVMSETTGLGIYFSQKTGYNIVISIVSVIVNLVLNFTLVPKYGAVGAAVATGISYMVFFWIRTLISRKLWYSFPVKKFIVITSLLLVISLVNCIVKNNIIVNTINIFSLILVCIIYRNLFKLLIDYKKQRGV